MKDREEILAFSPACHFKDFINVDSGSRLRVPFPLGSGCLNGRVTFITQTRRLLHASETMLEVLAISIFSNGQKFGAVSQIEIRNLSWAMLVDWMSPLLRLRGNNGTDGCAFDVPSDLAGQFVEAGRKLAARII
jgi:hypothetical protein